MNSVCGETDYWTDRSSTHKTTSTKHQWYAKFHCHRNWMQIIWMKNVFFLLFQFNSECYWIKKNKKQNYASELVVNIDCYTYLLKSLDALCVLCWKPKIVIKFHVLLATASHLAEKLDFIFCIHRWAWQMPHIWNRMSGRSSHLRPNQKKKKKRKINYFNQMFSF